MKQKPPRGWTHGGSKVELRNYLGGQFTAVALVPAVAVAAPLTGAPLMVAPGNVLVPVAVVLGVEVTLPLGVLVVPPVVAGALVVDGAVVLVVDGVAVAPVVDGVVAVPVPVAVVPIPVPVEVVPTPVPVAVVPMPEVGVTGHGFDSVPVFVGTEVVPAWFTPVAVLGALV